MKNRSGNREPVDIPRERHEGWGDEKATPTPEEEAHRHQLVEEMTPGSPIQSDRQRYAIRNASDDSDTVDNENEGGNNEVTPMNGAVGLERKTPGTDPVQ